MRATTPLLSLLLLATACGGSADSDGSGRGARSDKDRGEASMQLGGATWQAERAKAKIEDGKLTISASRTDMADGKVSRQSLSLTVREFDGAGDYTTGIAGSSFTAVGMDTKAVEAAAESEEASKGALTDMLSKAKHMMLTNAKVTVTAVDDTEVTGTFSWQPTEGSSQPAITGGTFRALVDS